MDFMERLRDKINAIPQLPIDCKLGYLGAGESLVVYPLPGSRVVQEYMNGTKDWQLNYEIAMKSKQQSEINQTLWSIQTELESLTELFSHNKSFQFESIVVTNKPFINQINDQGWYVFLLDIQATITIFKEDK
ncbi:minor capsid protein [Sutcliffiella horikoshii]|uniref:minor capsid protein n=1 Tax=Sutcliffiella horikoshii TaxID=79883 RepID=UPI00204229B9|nr:minor capsid protein [Sutcliffiella horikoshii]MCM3618750.1 minor capsid protein [Sutcliffiella horikoshii]